MSEGGTLGQITPHQSNIVASPNLTVEKHPVSSVKLVLITWIVAIGFDFLWHGGFLAEIYTRPNPALLDLEQAFIRIPLGYGSLLIQVVLLYWIFSLIGVNEWQKGLRVGFVFGGLMGIASILGQYSILTLELDLLVLWGIGQVIEFGVMGIILGAGILTASLKMLVTRVTALAAISMLLVIVLQRGIH